MFTFLFGAAFGAGALYLAQKFGYIKAPAV